MLYRAPQARRAREDSEESRSEESRSEESPMRRAQWKLGSRCAANVLHFQEQPSWIFKNFFDRSQSAYRFAAIDNAMIVG